VSAEGEIELRDLWRAMFRYKLVVFGSVALFTAAAVTFALMSPKIYRGEVLLAPAPAVDGTRRFPGAAGGGLAAIIGAAGLTDDGSRVTEAIAVMNSRAFTLKFIDDENLLPVLFAELWDAGTGKWRADVTPPSREDAYRLFDGEVRRVVEDPKTGLVRVEVYWADPTLAATWANSLVARLNAQMRISAIRQAESSLRYLHNELEKSNMIEVRQALYGLIETQTKRAMIANVEREFVFTVLDPATVPDLDRYVKPKRPFIAIAGLLLGGIVGCLASGILSLMRRRAGEAI
jgi:uncharacterized protein involved in exopolysaccharide biosynthesis